MLLFRGNSPEVSEYFCAKIAGLSFFDPKKKVEKAGRCVCNLNKPTYAEIIASRRFQRKEREVHKITITMLKTINFGKTLSKKQMQEIKGGGTCAAYMPTGNASGGPVATYNISKDEAQSWANSFPGGRWCCDSCGSATWYGV